MRVEYWGVVVSSASLLDIKVSLVNEVMNDTLDGAFGDPNLACNISHPHIGVTADEKQHMCVV